MRRARGRVLGREWTGEACAACVVVTAKDDSPQRSSGEGRFAERVRPASVQAAILPPRGLPARLAQLRAVREWRVNPDAELSAQIAPRPDTESFAPIWLGVNQ